jgi:hypothetical protein
MPGDAYDDLAAVARARGVDMSGVLNWIIAGARPALMKEYAAHQRALQDAASSREWQEMETDDALRTLRELLGKLQDEYTALSKRALGKEKRLAG